MRYRIPNYIMMIYSYDWEKLLLYFIIVYLTTFFNHQVKKYEGRVLGIEQFTMIFQYPVSQKHREYKFFSNTQYPKFEDRPEKQPFDS